MSAEISTLHVPFKRYLRENRLPFTYHDSSRPTGATLGDADFLVYLGPFCLHIEFKDKETKVSAVQKARHAELAATGTKVYICRKISEAVELVELWRSGCGSVDRPPPSKGKTPRGARLVTTTGEELVWNGSRYALKQ